MTARRIFSLFISFSFIILAGCQFAGLLQRQPTPEPAAPTPIPVELNVCLAGEPESLYYYAAASESAQTVLQAVYDGPIDIKNSEAEPVILEGMPDFEDGSASFQPVAVSAGEEVIDSRGILTSLQAGVEVFPSGCASPDCAVAWDGSSELQVDQLVLRFTLKPGILWSDGWPLQADDSVFSYELASDPATPVDKKHVDRSASYRALDDLTVEWTGKPGLVTDAFEEYFWMPLPRHTWGGLSARELLEDEAANRSPLGWGPYVVAEWIPGERISLQKNPIYYRMPEGLPQIDRVNFLFPTASSAEGEVSGFASACDVVADGLIHLRNLEAARGALGDAGFEIIASPSDNLEMLAFGVVPADYDVSYSPYRVRRQDFFGDERVRKAVVHCVDMDTIVNKLLKGSVVISASFLNADHPLAASAGITSYPYSPETGLSLLREVGWVDHDADAGTPLRAANVQNVLPDTLFEITLLTSTAELQREMAAEIAGDLGECGISAMVSELSPEELYAPAPEGVLFGRQFDLALLSMRTGDGFRCELFQGSEIPNEENYWLGESTGGANFTGWRNAEYDAACGLYKRAGMDDEVRTASGTRGLEILSEELPVIPVFHFPEIFAVSRNLPADVSGDTRELMQSLENLRLNSE